MKIVGHETLDLRGVSCQLNLVKAKLKKENDC